MTDAAKRYLELLKEMQKQRDSASGLTQQQEAVLAGELDVMWNQLDEAEQLQIEEEWSYATSCQAIEP